MAAAQSGSPQTSEIAGQVIEARTAAPLAAVLVQVEATRQRAVSGPDGHFVIADVPVGSQTLIVSVVGFGLVRRTVDVVAGQTTEVTIPVAEGASTYVEEVAVTGDRFRESQPGAASQAVLGSRELLALRGVIADDPFRAVQVLPGVAASDDYRADFAVRGLGPYHVGLSIDDVDSRLLFHTVRSVEDTGSLALINSDILEDATLLSGTYPQTTRRPPRRQTRFPDARRRARSPARARAGQRVGDDHGLGGADRRRRPRFLAGGGAQELHRLDPAARRYVD